MKLESMLLDEKLFGEKIRKRRKELGLTRKTLGAVLGVHYTSIRDWENGRSQPLAGSFLKLCLALEMDLRDFDKCFRIY